jgi:hypothetical protein
MPAHPAAHILSTLLNLTTFWTVAPTLPGLLTLQINTCQKVPSLISQVWAREWETKRPLGQSSSIRRQEPVTLSSLGSKSVLQRVLFCAMACSQAHPALQADTMVSLLLVAALECFDDCTKVLLEKHCSVFFSVL